ncbi:MAG: hypothetical protein K2Q14_08385 [Gammaproteobacteria bacterium]|nr:hypothetical protein [Gammaproteobacteria bacterium]
MYSPSSIFSEIGSQPHSGYSSNKTVFEQGNTGLSRKAITLRIVPIYNSIGTAAKKVYSRDNIAFLKNFIDIRSSREKLIILKKMLGLNILEMAAIFKVSRPTIYDWLENETEIHQTNKERINTICEFFKNWDKKTAGRLSNYLHKPLGNNNVSLFNLLKNEQLNEKEIAPLIVTISELILAEQERSRAHDAWLISKGFKLATREEIAERMDDIRFLDI